VKFPLTTAYNYKLGLWKSRKNDTAPALKLLFMNMAYPEMQVLAQTRLAITSGPSMPCRETICINFLYDARLYLTFFSIALMSDALVFINLQFSSIIQHSFMMEIKCSN